MNARLESALYVLVVFLFGLFSIDWLAPTLGLRPMATGGQGGAEALLLGMMALGFFVARRLTR